LINRTLACFLSAVALVYSGSAISEEQRIYQIDSLGNTQYHKPSFSIRKDGRMIETDPLGNKQYHKQQYQLHGDKVYQTDSLGNIQYHKPQLKMK
jgi:hypothetical protein